MKIAILDADPRICGPMSWMRHLAVGFTELGHEVQVVSSTKSGRARTSWGQVKWGGHWSVFTPELTVKDDDLATTLDAFDLVVLPEPKVPALDKEGMKFKDSDGHRVSPLLPVYVDALQRTKTRFIFALHGNDYDSKSAPFMYNLMCQDNWCGTVISHSERSTASNPVFKHPDVVVVHSALPYVPQRAINAPRNYTATIGTTGRFIFNKGPHLVALAAQYLEPRDSVVELWGSAAAGLGASTTFVTYEALLPLAKQYARYADQEAKKDDPKVTEHGNIIRPYHWDIRLNTGQMVRYLGNYTDPVVVAERLAVHVNLTGFKYSGGLVEYSTLEAIDGGAVCITPTHVMHPQLQTVEIPLTNPPGTPTSALKSPETIDLVARTINGSLQFALDGVFTRTSLVEHNRETIRTTNSAKTVAQTFLEGAFGK